MPRRRSGALSKKFAGSEGRLSVRRRGRSSVGYQGWKGLGLCLAWVLVK